MDILENECGVFIPIPCLVLNLQLDRSIIGPRDIKLLHLFSCEGINARFDSITNFVDLELYNLVAEESIRVPCWLCMKVNLKLVALSEHETLESDTWVALLFLATIHFRGHPLDVSFISFKAGLKLW